MSKSDFRLVNEEILREILRKKQILEKNPNYRLHYSNGKKKSIRIEANEHSVSLELEIYDTHTTMGRKTKAKEQKRCLKNLTNTMKWGLDSYEDDLSHDFIKCLGYKIEPELNREGYRTQKVRITGASWSPPSPEKIEREMNVFLSENSCLDNVIDKAVHAHFHIARIHPFNDGNGRAARAIQNIILEKSSFLPAIIKLSERLEYVHLIDCAVNSYKMAEGNLSPEFTAKLNQLYDSFDRADISEKEKGYYKSLVLEFGKAKMTKEQADFYNFMCLKVRDTIRDEIDKLYFRGKK